MEEAARTAQEDLDKSLQELAALRAAIEAEKLPLTRELGRLESRLVELRQQHDQTTKDQDLRQLEAGNLGQEVKWRQEEMAYVGNLIDEYARGYEASLHVSERGRQAPALEAALGAPQNKDLPLEQRLGLQVDLLRSSAERLGDLLGGTRYPGEAVDPTGALARGQFAMVGPVVLFAAEDGKTAGLALTQAGSTKPAVRVLDEALTAGLAPVVTAGLGTLPLDPSGGGALEELIHRGSLVGYFKKGGPIMWPLLIVSILAMTVVLERVVFLARERRNRDPEAVNGILARVEAGDVGGAIEVGRGSRDFVARSLTYALMHREKSLSGALMRAAGQEMMRYTRYVSILDTVVTMAPLLGLLGTVTGMMNSFGMLGGAELSAPAQITGGIAEALIATAFGLGIAIACLIPMNYLHNRSDDARHALEDASTHLELLMKPILDAEAQLAQPAPRRALAERTA
jgi:biopolymer transport protein ExbB